ncbi:MAG: CocE/NonD family hydrolase [Ilumatobacteraceae bacterium]
MPTDDGERLAVDLFLPDEPGAQVQLATLIEALPYRKDDVTESYASTYERFVDEGFAVVRVDLRGTGSSTGIATDEYPEVERTDLRSVCRWIAAQPWSSGRVGMFGTSYSGFNSLQMAAEVERLGVSELGAVVAAYATDDRYTDDVHYMGGVLRALDLIDYPLYMVSMNALPPVPAVFGDGWRDEWRRRLEHTPAWLIEWLEHPVDAPTWRRGSIRLGPDGAGYERMGCPTMLVVGWADGYRNNSFRVIEQYDRHGLPWRLLAGPWVHKAPERARPGPNVDDDVEIVAFFDEHLRGGAPREAAPAQVYVREPVVPEPDLAFHPGRWVDVDRWPMPGARRLVKRCGRTGTAMHRVEGDVGWTAWNSCAGGLPWGQPLDQRADNARSMCLDWPITEAADVLGNAVVRLRVASDQPYGHVSVKLCDVAPDGTSHLIARGMLDLRHRGCWPADERGEVGRAPVDLVPGDWLDVEIGVEATTWRLTPGHALRLAVAGTDWPNCWPAPGPVTLSIDLASIEVDLPVVDDLADSTYEFVPGSGPSPDEADGVLWQYERDVIAGTSSVTTRYGGTYDGRHGAVVTDDYRGEIGISTVDPAHGWARGSSSYTIVWPEATVRTESTLEMTSDAEAWHARIELRVWDGDELIAERTFTTEGPRR